MIFLYILFCKYPENCFTKTGGKPEPKWGFFSTTVFKAIVCRCYYWSASPSESDMAFQAVQCLAAGQS